MLAAKGKIAKAVILRPGALGDVLVARGVVAMLRQTFPDVYINLAAPGERGRFVCRPGWADQWLDWDRAAFSWLFAEGDTPPPAALQAAFAGTDLILSYVDNAGPAFQEKLRRLAPGASLLLSPSRPPPGEGKPVGEWLLEHLDDFLRRCGLLGEQDANAAQFAASRIALEPQPPLLPELVSENYIVMHPGSGGASKNWPIANFAELARYICADGARLVVTSGEADGDLGERLCRMVPDALHLLQPSLERLAWLLANAKLYVGNDSGVSHLAASVSSPTGDHPVMAVVFGPSDPAVWAPPGALVLRAGGTMGALPAAEAWEQIKAVLTF